MAADPYLKEHSKGVREIETTVKLMMAKAKQISSNLIMTFLELVDPYYNVKHSAVMEAIKILPNGRLVQQMVMVGQALRSPGRGIKDSTESPLSRMVLGICMNPILKDVEQSKGFSISATKKVACLAFVEKLLIVATTEEDMKSHLNKIGDALKEIGLDKVDEVNSCYVAVMFSNGQMTVRNDLHFKVADHEIRGIKEGEYWTFLGKTFKAK